MSYRSNRICLAKSKGPRRGRAHEEWICQSLLAKEERALGWLNEIGEAPPHSVCAGLVPGAGKPDVLFRLARLGQAGAPGSFSFGRFSAKLRTLGKKNPLGRFANHLHRTTVSNGAALGFFPKPNEHPSRTLFLSWQTSPKAILAMTPNEQMTLLDWLTPRWESIVSCCLFGPSGAFGATPALIFTLAKEQGPWLVAAKTRALSRESFFADRKSLIKPLSICSLGGGAISDGIILLQSTKIDMQFKIDMAPFFKTTPELPNNEPLPNPRICAALFDSAQNN